MAEIHKGGSANYPPVIKNFEKSPLSGDAGPPHPPSESVRQILRFFMDFSLKFQGFFGNFGDFSCLIIINNWI